MDERDVVKSSLRRGGKSWRGLPKSTVPLAHKKLFLMRPLASGSLGKMGVGVGTIYRAALDGSKTWESFLNPVAERGAQLSTAIGPSYGIRHHIGLVRFQHGHHPHKRSISSGNTDALPCIGCLGACHFARAGSAPIPIGTRGRHGHGWQPEFTPSSCPAQFPPCGDGRGRRGSISKSNHDLLLQAEL